MRPEDFFQVADVLPEGLLLLDSSGQILGANPPARRFLRLAPEDPAHGHHLREFVSSDEQELAVALRDWQRSRTPVPAVLKWKHLDNPDGTSYDCQGFVLQPPSGQQQALLILRCVPGKSLINNFLSLNEELVQQKRLLRELMHSRDALRQAHDKAQVTLSSIGDAVITTDMNGRTEYLNPVAESLTGWTNAEAQNRPLLEVFHIVDEMTRRPAANPVARCIAENRIVGLANHTVLISRDGSEYVIEDSAAPIRDRFGRLYGVVLVFRDATGDRLARHQLEYLAQHDTLTGLKNRYFFEQQLKHAVDLAARGRHSFALLYIDLDQFKIINDTAGHAAGDELLMEVARHLTQRLRQGDVLARLGGDEFGVLVDGTEAPTLHTIAADYQQKIEGYRFVWDGVQYDVTCSIGATVVDQDTRTAAEAMRRADIACYIAKHKGRSQYHVYTQEDQDAIPTLSEVNVVADIRFALSNDQFELHFQPIRTLAAAATAPIYEALIRMNKDGKLLSPAAFLPVAERNGLMSRIDQWVLQQATALLRNYCDAGRGCRISINLSGTSLGDIQMLADLRAFLAENPLLADHLVLEITETSAVGQLDVAGRLMHELRELGARFALDDFGTGFSSFTYLKHLPVDYVKIDGTFVRDIVDDPVDQAMVRSINQIAHSLGKITIAEFVENEAILQELKSIGVDMVQGYHVGKPQKGLPDSHGT